jgi:hypothetical protein
MIQANFILPCMLKKDKTNTLCSLYHLLCPTARAIGYKKYPIMLESYKFIKHNIADYTLSIVYRYYDVTYNLNQYFDKAYDRCIYILHPTFIMPSDAYLSYFFVKYSTFFDDIDTFVSSGKFDSDAVIWDTLNNVVVSFNNIKIKSIYDGFNDF